MSRFKSKDRQRIIDGYLSATGRNLFVPAEFVDWLEGQTDHEAWPWFFGSGDAEAARQHRVLLARQLANGLRIVARVSEAPAKGSSMKVAVREYPALVSPIASRKDGGGYQPFDPKDAGAMAELRRQGATALRSWLARYRGMAEDAGVDLGPIEEIAAFLESSVAGAA